VADATAKTMSPREWGLLLLLSLFWGGSFFFIGVAVKELPPLTIVASRVALAAAILWLVAPLTGMTLALTRASALAFLRLGLINNVIPFVLIVWGQTHLASGLASILNAATPLFTVLVAHALTADERLTPMRLAGALCGLAGVAWMIGPNLLGGLGESVPAELAVLGAAISYAFGSLYGRRFRALGFAPIAIAAGQVTAASLVLIPLAVVIDQPWSLPAPSLATLGAIGAIAAVSTALAYIVYFRILAGAGATNVMLVTLLAPATSILLGAIFLHERLALRHFAGLGLIALGLAFIDGRLPRRLGQAGGRGGAPRISLKS